MNKFIKLSCALVAMVAMASCDEETSSSSSVSVPSSSSGVIISDYPISIVFDTSKESDGKRITSLEGITSISEARLNFDSCHVSGAIAHRGMIRLGGEQAGGNLTITLTAKYHIECIVLDASSYSDAGANVGVTCGNTSETIKIEKKETEYRTVDVAGDSNTFSISCSKNNIFYLSAITLYSDAFDLEDPDLSSDSSSEQKTEESVSSSEAISESIETSSSVESSSEETISSEEVSSSKESSSSEEMSSSEESVSSEEQSSSEESISSEEQSSSSEETSSSEEQTSSAEESSFSEEISSSEESVSSEEQSSSEQQNSSSESSEPEPVPMTLSTFNSAIAASKPTKIETKQSYLNPAIGETLSYRSTLEIEYVSSTEVKTKFTYSYQYLNMVGEEDPIGTKSGTIYSSGSNVYELVNGQLVLAKESDKVFLTASLNVSRERYFNEYDLEDDYLWCDVKNESVENVLGENYNISGLTLEIELFEGKIDTLKIKYTTDQNASVSSSSTYSYDDITIEIPE